MIKNKFKILIIGLAVISAGIFSVGIADASNSLIYISPNNLDKKVGESFVLVTTVDTAGSKVCAVEGKLQLDKLTCQNIVVGEEMMAQKSPSCADPSFLLGIPNCTTVNKTLFTVVVKGNSVGEATASFTGVDVVGEGFSLSTTSVGGNYNLSAVSVAPVVNPTVDTPVVPVIVPAENCACEDWSGWERVDCGAGSCESNQLAQTRSRVCSPDSCEATVENRCVADAYCASAIIPVEEDILQTASVLDAAGSVKYGWWIGLIVLLALVVFISYSKKKKRK